MSEAVSSDDQVENDAPRSSTPEKDDSVQSVHDNKDGDNRDEQVTSNATAKKDDGADAGGFDGEEDDVEVIIQDEGGGRLTFAAKQVAGARYNRIERIHLPTATRSGDSGFERSIFEELDIPIPDDIALPHPDQLTVFDVPLSSYRSKPWDLPGANISDWFNYGLNSATWDRYRIRQRRIRKELTGILDARIASAESSGRLKQSKGLETPTDVDTAGGSSESTGVKRTRPESFPPPPPSSTGANPPAFPMPPPILAASGPNAPPHAPPFPPVAPGFGPTNMGTLRGPNPPLMQPPAQTPGNTFHPPQAFPNPPGMMPPVMPNMQQQLGYPPVNPSMQSGPGQGFPANVR